MPANSSSTAAPRRRLSQYFHPVARIDEISAGPRRFQLLNEEIVLFLSDGVPAALRNRCIHRGTQLSLGDVTAGGTLRCAYHGWEFDRKGTCVHIPALAEGLPIPKKAQVAAYEAREAYGVAWVALERPVADVPVFPNGEWADPKWR